MDPIKALNILNLYLCNSPNMWVTLLIKDWKSLVQAEQKVTVIPAEKFYLCFQPVPWTTQVCTGWVGLRPVKCTEGLLGEYKKCLLFVDTKV